MKAECPNCGWSRDISKDVARKARARGWKGECPECGEQLDPSAPSSEQLDKAVDSVVSPRRVPASVRIAQAICIILMVLVSFLTVGALYDIITAGRLSTGLLSLLLMVLAFFLTLAGAVLLSRRSRMLSACIAVGVLLSGLSSVDRQPVFGLLWGAPGALLLIVLYIPRSSRVWFSSTDEQSRKNDNKQPNNSPMKEIQVEHSGSTQTSYPSHDNFVYLAQNLVFAYELLRQRYGDRFPNDESLLVTSAAINEINYVTTGAISVKKLETGVHAAKLGECLCGLSVYQHENELDMWLKGSASDVLLNYIVQVEVFVFSVHTELGLSDECIVAAVLDRKGDLRDTIEETKRSFARGDYPREIETSIDSFMDEPGYEDLRNELGILPLAE